MNAIKKLSNFLKNSIVLFWWHLPIKRKTRQNIKTVFFTIFGFLLKNTKPYKNWVEIRRLTSDIEIISPERCPAEWSIAESNIEVVRKMSRKSGVETVTNIAIIIHAYYSDIFRDLVERISKEFSEIPYSVKLYISTIESIANEVTDILSKSGLDYEVEVFANHGRDILPFLRTAEKISSPETIILKLHTKRSDHRLTGELWRKELYNSLLSKDKILKTVEYFNNNRNVGIVGPSGNIVPMSLYFGGNALALSYYCNIFNISAKELKNMLFVAGSMFYARTHAIEALIKLQIPSSMFEEESGQHDGTMAHAIERVFTLSAYHVGMSIADTSFPKDIEKVHITENHPYTW